jgi:uncharacterized UBP type Zn finger protein
VPSPTFRNESSNNSQRQQQTLLKDHFQSSPWSLAAATKSAEPFPSKAERSRATLGSPFGSTFAVGVNRGRGMLNLGNTCYMNATIHALSAVAFFVKAIRDYVRERQTPADADSFLWHVNQVLVQLQSGSGVSEKSIRALKDVFCRRNRLFAGSAQHDAHEFLTECLGRLHLDAILSAVSAKHAVHLVDPDCLGAAVAATPTFRTFSFDLQRRLTCDNDRCGYSRLSSEHFLDLSLDWRSVVSQAVGSPLHSSVISIAELLQQYFLPNSVECKCDRCGFTHSSVQLQYA